MRTFILFALVLMSVSAASAQEPHRFYDKPAKIQVAANLLAAGADLAQTCRNLSRGGHEDWMPTQSCAGVAGIMVAGQITQESLAYLLHHKGHHRLERATRFISLAGNTSGLTYSHLHGSF